METFKALVRPGVMLIGEAAGRLDPAWGQGVLNALYSGIVAAKAILSSLANPATEGWHQAAYDQWFVERFEDAAAALKAAYEERGINFGIQSFR